VVVHPGAEEGQLVLGRRVAPGQLAQVRLHRLLGQPGRQIERAPEAHALRDAGEELVDRRHADRGEHRLQVLLGDCGVGAQRRSQVRVAV
jgi:hypothetical protein